MRRRKGLKEKRKRPKKQANGRSLRRQLTASIYIVMYHRVETMRESDSLMISSQYFASFYATKSRHD